MFFFSNNYMQAKVTSLRKKMGFVSQRLACFGAKCVYQPQNKSKRSCEDAGQSLSTMKWVLYQRDEAISTKAKVKEKYITERSLWTRENHSSCQIPAWYLTVEGLGHVTKYQLLIECYVEISKKQRLKCEFCSCFQNQPMLYYSILLNSHLCPVAHLGFVPSSLMSQFAFHPGQSVNRGRSYDQLYQVFALF